MNDEFSGIMSDIYQVEKWDNPMSSESIERLAQTGYRLIGFTYVESAAEGLMGHYLYIFGRRGIYE